VCLRYHDVPDSQACSEERYEDDKQLHPGTTVEKYVA
jgi:hypothetical protein